jgi:N utilization substance protein A
VDPVGACVGIRGVRIQAIVRELNDEKIDVIEWNSDPAAYIAKAISPARVIGVYLNEHTKGTKTATVVVPEDQLSLAIGRDGQNARLAAKLTSWRIDIKSLPEAASDSLNKLRTDPEYAALVEPENETLPQIEGVLAKKAEGRPVTPEEYQVLSQFVDRVERGIIRQRAGIKMAEDEQEKAARAEIPVAAFEMPLEDLSLNERVVNILTEASILTVGDLILQLKLNPDTILGLNGVGPKTMSDIEAALAAIVFPKVEEEAAPEEVALAEAVELEAVAPSEEEPAIPLEVPAMGVALETEVVQPAEAPVPVESGTAETPPSPEEITDFDKLFALKPDLLSTPAEEEEEGEEGGEDKTAKKGKKKKKSYVEVEYDPDRDITIAHKKRKRGEDWDDNWKL